MKKSLLARAGAALVALPLIILIQAPSGAAGIEAAGGGASSAQVLCAEKAGVFPSSVYTRLYTGSNGSVSSFEIHLYYAEQNCSEILYSSSAGNEASGIDTYQQRNDSVAVL